MLGEQLERVGNPHTWAYSRYYHGHDINIMAYDTKVKQFYSQRINDLMGQFCEKMGLVALKASTISERQRAKYAGQRIRDGRNTYYLFNRRQMPPDIIGYIGKDPNVFIY
jgi:hypothetical protein